MLTGGSGLRLRISGLEGNSVQSWGRRGRGPGALCFRACEFQLTVRVL